VAAATKPLTKQHIKMSSGSNIFSIKDGLLSTTRYYITAPFMYTRPVQTEMCCGKRFWLYLRNAWTDFVHFFVFINPGIIFLMFYDMNFFD
jgi:hypothetical protein